MKALMNRWGRGMALAVLGTTLVNTVKAQDTTVVTNTVVVNEQPPPDSHRYYRSEEVSLDAFGTVSVGQETLNNLSGTTVKNNGRLGAGAGLNVFLCRFAGIGGDFYTEDTHHSFVDSASGNIILRLPLGETILAPYIYGGGGHQFDNITQNFGQFGGGLEVRFVPSFGIFADVRYVIPNKTDNYGVGRLGIRLSF